MGPQIVPLLLGIDYIPFISSVHIFYLYGLLFPNLSFLLLYIASVYYVL